MERTLLPKGICLGWSALLIILGLTSSSQAGQTLEGQRAPVVAQPAPSEAMIQPPQQALATWNEGNTVTWPALDVAKLSAQDAQDAQFPGLPERIGVNRQSPIGAISPQTIGTISQQNDQTIWSVKLQATGASAVRVHLSQFDLPENAALFVADKTGKFVESYRGKGTTGKGQFWTVATPGDQVFIEYQGPAKVNPTFLIDEISHIYKTPSPNQIIQMAEVPTQLNCHNDVMCESVSSAARDAVGFMIFTVPNEGSYICTGALLNDNDPNTFAGYFLTANHCMSDQATVDSLTVYWFFQSESCGGNIPEFYEKPYTSSGTLLYNSSNNDTCFVRLEDDPMDGQGLAGWTTNDVASGDNVIGIHHPAGSHKRVSYGTAKGAMIHCQIALPGSRYWYLDWYDGVTEGGSSGSPLFDTGWHVVGQLYGVCTIPLTSPACDNPGSYDTVYGKFGLTHPNITTWLDYIAPDDDFEDNDSLFLPKLVGRSTYDMQLVDFNDYFKIQLVVGGPLAVTANFNHEDVNLDLELLDGIGNVLDSSIHYTYDTETVSANVPPGEYIIKANKAGKWGGAYSLTVAADNEANYLGDPCGCTGSCNGHCLTGPIVNPFNGHKYYLFEKSTWTVAESWANDICGHLTTINDSSEQNWVYNTFSTYGGGNRALWIGYTDKDSEGNFTWVNGETPGYTNWDSGEPNNTNEEDYVHIWDPNHTTGAGKWNDTDDIVWGGDSGPYGVAEIVDCNDNGTDDGCDIANGASDDVNGNGIPDECETGVDANGWIRDWAVLGPFTGNTLDDQIAGGCGYTEKNIDPSVNNQTKGHTWLRVYATPISTAWGVDFHNIYNDSGNVNGYAHVYIHNPITRSVRTRVGSDDSFEIFVDGIERDRHDGPRGNTPDEDISDPFVLSAGWHRVMVHAANGDNDWNFVLRFDDGGLNVLTDIVATPYRGDIPTTEGLIVPTDVDARPPAIRDWLVLGNSSESAFVGAGCDASCPSDVLAANGGGAQADMVPSPAQATAGKTWTDVRDTYLLDFTNDYLPLVFKNYYADGDDKVVYLHTYIYNPGSPVQARVAMGSDDSGQVWVNGTQLIQSCMCRGGTCDDDISNVFTLPTGCNRLMFRVDQGIGDWHGMVRLIEASTSNPLANVWFQIDKTTVAADFDGDLDVDPQDIVHLISCGTGPRIEQTDPNCLDADLDNDGDVDQLDFGLLQKCHSGTNIPTLPNCDD